MIEPDVPMPADRFPYEMPDESGPKSPTPEKPADKPARKNNRLTRSQERQLEDWLDTFDHSKLATCDHSEMAAHWNGGTGDNGNPPAFRVTKHNIASALAVLGVKPADEKSALAALTARVTVLEASFDTHSEWIKDARSALAKDESDIIALLNRIDKLDRSVNAITNHPKLV